jgi:SAM-dependent methyltransferase
MRPACNRIDSRCCELPDNVVHFEDTLLVRSAAVYADFVVEHLTENTRLLDCGCGAGSITVGLAGRVQLVVGVDLDAPALKPAAAYVASRSVRNVLFVAADARRLPFADADFGAVLLHSVVETVSDPATVVREACRVLVSGGLLAAASVDYGGLLVEGPHRETLERFFAVRERLWSFDGIARSRAGRELRGLLRRCGLMSVSASGRYISYGTATEVRAFGEDRASECENSWFSSRARAHGLLTEDELHQTQQAWQEWSASPDSFLLFAWCHALGRKP